MNPLRNDGRRGNTAATGNPHRPLADFTADPRIPLLSATALVVGTCGAGAAWILVRLIAFVTNIVWFHTVNAVSLSLADAARNWWMIALPILGGLIVGFMARFGSDKIRGHGIPEAIEAILIGQSRMSPKVAVLKPLSSAIAIGTGGPFGAEGPIIMTGGAIGSIFAQCFDMSAAERKTLLVAGAAAGMTGVFGTPMAAILLAVELLLFEWRPRSFIPVAVAAITALFWRNLMFGPGPLFPFSGTVAITAEELAACAAIGLAAGLVSGLYTKIIYAVEDAFQHLPIHWMWWPALGGLVVGCGGLVEPRALGVGYDVIRDLVSGNPSLRQVWLIFLVKAAIWTIALSSGTSGGVLAPLLILGGTMGWLIGHLLPGAPGFWALIGMAAMLGGTMRAPLTGAIFAIELTGDMQLLPSLLAATVIGYGTTVMLLRRSILTEKIARRGQHITREYAIDPYALTRVREIMVRDVETLSADISLAAAITAIETGTHRIYPVVDHDKRPIGLASRADALRWKMEGGHATESLRERVSDASITVVHPDDIVLHAVDVMLTSDQGRLPVTDPKTGQLVGLVARRDLLQVRATSRRLEVERQAYFRRRAAG